MAMSGETKMAPLVFSLSTMRKERPPASMPAAVPASAGHGSESESSTDSTLSTEERSGASFVSAWWKASSAAGSASANIST